MLLTTQGIGATYLLNTPAWYIIAMFVCMLPLFYILMRNDDFYLYVFTPTAAVLLTIYMYRCPESYLDGDGLLAASSFVSITTGGIIRALCGISWGAVCRLISENLRTKMNTKGRRIALTLSEIAMYTVFFLAWFNEKSDKNTVYGNMFLLVLITAVIFSGQSYVSHLFELNIFKYAGSLSLAFFLNHYNAVKLADTLYPEAGYTFSVLLSLGFSAVSICIYYILLHAARTIKIKALPDNTQADERNDKKCPKQ